MIKANLYISPYIESNQARKLELETVYIKNLKAGFENIWLVVEEKDRDVAYDLIKRNYQTDSLIHVKIVPTRPIFQEYITLANNYDDSYLHCVCNSDIYIEEEGLGSLKSLPWHQKLFVGLSRWDLGKEGSVRLLERQDSADFWVWQGKCDVTTTYCPLGYPGIDNSVAWKFKERDYKVVNPSRDIKTFHLHNQGGNNYRTKEMAVKAEMICPPPYFFHPPIFKNQI